MPKDFSKLDLAVPMPVGFDKANYYPWATLRVGDSFEIPEHIKMSSMRSLASRANRRMKDKNVFFKVVKRKNYVIRVR